MTRTRLSIAMLVLFAPAIALAHGGGGGNGGGNGNGGVGGGMGGGHGGMSANANGHGIGSMNGIGVGVGVGGSGHGGVAAHGSGRAVDAGPDTGSARGMIAQAREDARERAAARLAASNNGMNANAHGKAVSTEAHLARSQHDGGIGQDVRAVALDKSNLKTHTRTHTRVASVHTSTKTHPVNHGAAVSAEAHLARSQHDGGIGKDVSAVARDKSTLPHATTSSKASTDTSTKTHPVNHGAAVSAEAHLARSQHDGGIGKDVSAVARDKSTLPHATSTTDVASTDTTTRTHPVNHGAAVSAEAHLARSQHDGGIGQDVSVVTRDKSTLPTHNK